MRYTGKAATALSAVAVLALALAGCGSSDNGGSGSSSKDKVGVILPDTTTSVRWEANDRPSLKKAFDDAGIDSDIQNAQGDTTKFGTICESMINEGVKVLLIVNLDSDSGAACLKKAKDAGVLSIDYDRLTLGGGASYYVSFDNVVVGQLQGEGLQKCLDAEGKTTANIAYINGAATDNNAALFKQGYAAALKPKIDSGAYKLVGDQSGDWKAETAATVFDGIYTAQGGKLDGLIVANDGMGDGVAARLAADGVAGKIPFTGQDATTTGLQRVLAKVQCGTVYKNTNLEADLASKLAIALIKGDKATANSLANKTVQDTQLKVDVKSALATPEWISDPAGVKKVIADGFAKASDVCTGSYAAICQANGIS